MISKNHPRRSLDILEVIQAADRHHGVILEATPVADHLRGVVLEATLVASRILSHEAVRIADPIQNHKVVLEGTLPTRIADRIPEAQSPPPARGTPEALVLHEDPRQEAQGPHPTLGILEAIQGHDRLETPEALILREAHVYPLAHEVTIRKSFHQIDGQNHSYRIKNPSRRKVETVGSQGIYSQGLSRGVDLHH